MQCRSCASASGWLRSSSDSSHECARLQDARQVVDRTPLTRLCSRDTFTCAKQLHAAEELKSVVEDAKCVGDVRYQSNQILRGLSIPRNAVPRWHQMA